MIWRERVKVQEVNILNQHFDPISCFSFPPKDSFEKALAFFFVDFKSHVLCRNFVRLKETEVKSKHCY